MGRGVAAALSEAGLHSARMTGTEKEACAASAVIGQKLVGVGPETDLQGSPAGAWSEGEACVMGQAAAGAAWEAWGRGASWVTTEEAPGGQEAEPESKVNVEKEAVEGGGTLLTG